MFELSSGLPSPTCWKVSDRPCEDCNPSRRPLQARRARPKAPQTPPPPLVMQNPSPTHVYLVSPRTVSRPPLPCPLLLPHDLPPRASSRQSGGVQSCNATSDVALYLYTTRNRGRECVEPYIALPIARQGAPGHRPMSGSASVTLPLPPSCLGITLPHAMPCLALPCLRVPSRA